MLPSKKSFFALGFCIEPPTVASYLNSRRDTSFPLSVDFVCSLQALSLSQIPLQQASISIRLSGIQPYFHVMIQKCHVTNALVECKRFIVQILRLCITTRFLRFILLPILNAKPELNSRSLAFDHAYLFFLFSVFPTARMKPIDFLLVLIVADASVSSPNSAWFYSEQLSG